MKIKFLLILIIFSKFNILFSASKITLEDYFLHKRGKPTYIPTITILALQMGYYDAKNNLMNKAHEHLNKIDDKLKKNIEDLKIQRRYVLASYNEDQYLDIYDYYASKFDNAFNKWDRYFVTQGDFLDDNHAPEADKEKLIQYAMEGLKRRINKIIAKSSKELNL